MSSPVKVLVTGFGPFLDITRNPSWEIARQLPSSLTDPDGQVITIFIQPVPAAYHKILTQIPLLIEQHAPNIILHIGLDVDSNPGVFKLERSAPKEGYHHTPDIERRVFTRLENKATFAKTPASLTTGLGVETAVEKWWDACSGISLSKPGGKGKGNGKGKSKEHHIVQVKASDDVGTYVCGFEYYVSLLEMQKRSGKRDVAFLHVPNLQSEEEVSVGVRVTEELIRALVGVWKT